VDITGSVDCTDDGDFGDDVIVGANAIVVSEAGSNFELAPGAGLVITGSVSDSFLKLVEDATHYGTITYSNTDNRLEYFSYNAGGSTSHVFTGDITASTGDINISTNSKKILFLGANQQIGTSTGNYPEYVYADKLRWKTDHAAFDDLDDVQIIQDMHQDGQEILPPLVMDGEFVDPAKITKLLFGAIRQLKRELEDLKNERAKDTA
jgi:hypothetical protein